MSADSLFGVFFLCLLAVVTGARLGLAWRQIRHVRRHRQALPPAFQARVSLAQHQKAADYTSAKTQLRMIQILLEVLLLGALTWGGGLDQLNQSLRAWPSLPVWGQNLLLVGAVLLLGALLELPLTLYATFGVEARFGFNRITPRLFVTDLLRGALLSVLLGAPVLLTAIWMMQSLGRFWWLWAWGAWMFFNIFLLALYPVWIAPLFNRFTPLPEGELRQRVEALLQRCGFRSSGLFVMDGSKRSSHGNAYFTGFGKNRRVVFFDTLLDKLDAAETEAVLAHELGHYHRHHVQRRMILMFVMSLLFLALLGALQQAPWFYAGLGVHMPGTAVALILFVLVVPVLSFPLQPLMSYYSRRHEFEADAYAASVASAKALIHALLKLYQDNASTLTPDPLHSLIYDSHPPAAQRIARLATLASD